MTTSWRARLRGDPRLVELRSWQRKQSRTLADKHFIFETAWLKEQLERAYLTAESRQALISFFERFSRPTGLHLGKVSEYIKTLPDKRLRTLLRRYVSYSTRFRVVMYLHKKGHHVLVQPLEPSGSQFEAKISGGHLKPNRRILSADSFETLFDADFRLSGRLGKALKSDKLAFFRIIDHEGGSALNELELVGYQINRLTLVVHEAEQPYLMCLIGENARIEDWRKMAPIVRSLQKKCYGRERAGRRRKLSKFRKALALQGRPGPQKAKAFRLSEKNKMESNQVYLSDVRNMLRKGKF